MNGTMAGTVLEDGQQDFQPSTRYLGTLRQHSPSKRASSAISKTYKAASTLYLTRRLSEALHTIEPLVTVTRPASDDEEVASIPAIATATRSLRVKVWNFYLTLLNAIIELGPEDGKADFGGSVWKGILNKVRDGSIWEEVVQSGYAGREGSVDPDVVANLATLLLGQAPSQILTQQRLETYLSLSGQPDLALAERLGSYGEEHLGLQRRPSHASGANTPRDLNSRAKILELYTLHVLPRNDEWETSREFIKNSNELDEERKDAFLYTLDTLQEQAENERDHEQELLRQRDEELARQRQEAEQKRLEESRILEQKARESEAASRASEAASRTSEAPSNASSSKGVHHRTNSEVDYGIDDSTATANNNSSSASKSRRQLRKKESSTKQLRNSQPVPTSTSTGGGGSGSGGGGSSRGLPRASRSKKASSGAATSRGRSAIHRLPALLALLRKLLAHATQSLTKDPATLTRSLLFLFAFILAFARRDVRDRLGSVLGFGWGKLKATIGMGTKVSYI